MKYVGTKEQMANILRKGLQTLVVTGLENKRAGGRTGQPNLTREISFSSANGDRGKSSFPVLLTTESILLFFKK